jgi:hypothetical protein
VSATGWYLEGGIYYAVFREKIKRATEGILVILVQFPEGRQSIRHGCTISRNNARQLAGELSDTFVQFLEEG